MSGVHQQHESPRPARSRLPPGSRPGWPMASASSMAGTMSDHTEAATITPAANPRGMRAARQVLMDLRKKEYRARAHGGHQKSDPVTAAHVNPFAMVFLLFFPFYFIDTRSRCACQPWRMGHSPGLLGFFPIRACSAGCVLRYNTKWYWGMNGKGWKPMPEYVIFTDATVDLTDAFVESEKIGILPNGIHDGRR